MTRLQMQDRFALDDGAKVHISDSTGYMTATPRVARTGVQLYMGSELGRPDLKVVRVYRPEEAVFHVDAMQSMAHKPITDDHPPVMVDAKNWSKYAKGHSGETTMRDGDFVRVPMMVSDGGLIAKYKAGKAEISVGYGCDIEFKSGTTDKGEMFDAVQSGIVGNHIAIVDQARGGQKLRLGDGAGASVDHTTLAKIIEAVSSGKVNTRDALDSATADSQSLALNSTDTNYRFTKGGTVYTQAIPAMRALAAGSGHGDLVCAMDAILSFATDGPAPAPSKLKDTRTMTDKTRTMMVDGYSVTVDDRDAQIIERALKDADTKFVAMKKEADEEKEKTKAKDAQIVTLTTDAAKAAAEVVTLKDQLAKATLTPALLDAAVTDRAETFGRARIVHPDIVTDGKSTDEVRKEVVMKVIGDKAKDWNADSMKISFDSLCAHITADQLKVGATASTSSATALADSFRETGRTQTGQTHDSNTFHATRAQKLNDAWRHPNGVAPKQ